MGQFEQNSFRSAGCTLAYIAAAMLIVFILSVIMTGCKTKYIAAEPVIVHERDSIYKVQQIHTHDTLRQKDSTVTIMVGDTVLIERWHNTQIINHINKIDTIIAEKEKEVPVPYPKPYPVEKELTWWQKLCLKFGKLSLALISLWGVWKIAKWTKFI